MPKTPAGKHYIHSNVLYKRTAAGEKTPSAAATAAATATTAAAAAAAAVGGFRAVGRREELAAFELVLTLQGATQHKQQACEKDDGKST